MKPILSVCLAASFLGWVGCSSTPTRVDRGPIHAHTFSFIDTGAKPAQFADNRAELHPRIQEAITKALAGKGLSKVATGGDVLVGYLVIVSDGVSTTSVDDYFGYGMAATDLQEKAHKAFAIEDKNRSPYPAGTLVIDVVDGKKFQLLRRHYVCRPIMRQLPLDERLARLQEAVDEALQGLQVVP
jgi:hypothetical protein